MAESNELPKLKILMLHGFTQNGRLFEIKTKALKRSLEKAFPMAPQAGHLPSYPGGVELVYPTAPIRLNPADIPGYVVDNSKEVEQAPEAFAWWRKTGDKKPYLYEGMDAGLATIAEILQNQGPFAGVVGFSQGAAAAAIVASLLEDGRIKAFDKTERDGSLPYPESFRKPLGSNDELIHPPLKFGVAYSGFAADDANPLYEPFYSPPLQTPILHVLGTVDTIVSEDRSLRLLNHCAEGKGENCAVPRLVYHPGGHFLPSSNREHANALIAFILDTIGAETRRSKLNGMNERVEDMEMPF